MNLKQKMTELIEYFKTNQFNGYDIELYPELEGEWHEEYAIAQDFQADTWDEGEYFDYAQFEYDLRRFVAEWFGLEDVRRSAREDKEPPKQGELVLRMWGSNEIEVYYEGYKPLRKFHTPHDGFQGCPKPLPQALKDAVDSLDGKTMTLEDAEWDVLRELDLDIEYRAVPGGYILAEEEEGKLKHVWKLIEFTDVLTFPNKENKNGNQPE